MQQRIGQPDALAKTLGQMPDQPATNVFQPAALADVIDRLQSRRAVHLPQSAAEIEVFLDLHLGVERDVLRQIAEIVADLLGLVEDVEAVDARPAAGRREVAGQDLERGRFPRPIGTEESDDLPLLHLKTDPIDGPDRAVNLGQI